MSKKNKTFKQKTYSGIQQHKVKGKTLIPPFADYPNLKLTSWIDDRLPELLWACLLVSCGNRETALATFQEVINYVAKKAPEASGKITHTGLSQLDDQIQKDILSIITSRKENKEILQPLILYESLPAKQQWEQFLPSHANIDIQLLIRGVARSLGHQSQEATDCRWLYVMTFLMTSKLRLHDKEELEGLFYYPNFGDLRKIRPSIRSFEVALSLGLKQKTDWPEKFWNECLVNTPCYPLPSVHPQSHPNVGTSIFQVNEVYTALRHHMSRTIETTNIDPKHDTTFGIVLYSMAILQELLRVGNSTSILARTGLRTILESFVTLSYLLAKNDTSLWQTHRVHGAGQAKLALIKLDELDNNPSYVDKDTLQQLANEDMWQEFLPVNLGHWDKTDLRKMSIDAGVKDEYDKFYSWTSSFCHAHWGSVRDTVLQTCGNPLHRLHRISRDHPRMLPDVIPDACYLIDKMLELISNAYPNFDHRVSVNS